MILLHLGHVPLARHHHQALFETFARSHLFVYVEKSALPRSVSRDPASTPAAPFSGGVVPAKGFMHVPIRGCLPFERFDKVSQWNWWLGIRALLPWLRSGSSAPLVLILQTPGLIPTFRGLDVDLRVYQVIDDYVGLASDPVVARRIAKSHERSLREADVVWAISKTLADAIRPVRADVRLTSTGVDYQRFAAARTGSRHPDIECIPSPRIGLVGVLNDRIDWTLLEALALRHTDWNLVLVGPVRHAGPETWAALTRLKPLGNVFHIGEVTEDAIPAIVAGFDVGLVAYRAGGGTLGINPLKLYQYLAAGKPVVATALPILVEFEDVAQVTRTVDEFEAAIVSILRAGGGGSAVVEARQRRARAFDWGVIAADRTAMIADALRR